MLSAKEFERIKLKADQAHMQIAPYIRSCALDSKIIVKDYHVIMHHTREIAVIRNSINRLIFTIDATNNYLPREIESIVKMLNEIFRSENEPLKTVREDQSH